MAIYLYAHGAPRPNGYGTATEEPALHLHPGCPGAPCDRPDGFAFNHVSEAYAVMRAVRSGLRFDEAQNRYVRNRVASFKISGDVAEEWFTRDPLDVTRTHVDDLPQDNAQPGCEGYAQWRENYISAAPSRAVAECSLISPVLARALGIAGVDGWADAQTAPKRRAGAHGPERVDTTTTERLEAGREPVYVRTLPERHHLSPGKTTRQVQAVGHEGYWFTLPGDFPSAMPEFLHQSRETFAVYQSPHIVPGAWVWVVKAAVGGRIWGSSIASRGEAVREAVRKVAAYRTKNAKAVTVERVVALGLPEVPHVRVTVDVEGWGIHVRCACPLPESDVVGRFDSAGEAAEYISGGRAPWKLCEASPQVIHTREGTPLARIVDSGGRDEEGRPMIAITALEEGGRVGLIRLEDAVLPSR